jgi:hypothetical protein
MNLDTARKNYDAALARLVAACRPKGERWHYRFPLSSLAPQHPELLEEVNAAKAAYDAAFEADYPDRGLRA